MKAKRRRGSTAKKTLQASTAPDTSSTQDTSRAPSTSSASSESHDNTPRLSRRRRLLFLSIPYLLLVLLLLAAEGLVRLTLPHVSTLEAWVASAHQQQGFTDRERVTIFEGDPLLFWRLRPNLKEVVWDFTVVSTNAQGLRHEGDIVRKKPGAIRVVCLGDSVTFGYRVPVVWPERPGQYARDWLPYPMLLEKALRAANPGREVEVIALAVPGYTSYQGLLWLRRDIERLQPDVVTICFGWNDTVLRAAPDSTTMKDDWLSLNLRRLMTYSQAATHAARFVASRKRAGNNKPASETTPRVPREEYVRNVLEMARLSRDAGAVPVVVAPVYRDAVKNPGEAERVRAHRDALRAAAAQAGLSFLDIPELNESSYPANEGLFGEAIHPNHLGHRLMAHSLLKLFAERHMLKDLNVPVSFQF